jgi:S-disulfanyl-L-cysteine oxidoreductase SoxD
MRILIIVWVSASMLNAERTVWDGVYSESQANEGAPLYDQHCSVCHGDTLNARDGGPPLLGPDFRSNWDGKALENLFERIRTTMPLNKPQSLSRTVLVDILAYLLSINGFPSGESKLTPSREDMAGIKILAYPPK